MSATIVDKQLALQRLADNGGNAKKTAAELNVPRTTLRSWAGRAAQHSRAIMHKDATVAEVDQLADEWDDIAHMSTATAKELLAGLTPEQKMRMTAKDIREIIVSAAVATEKRQLLRGKPTDNIVLSLAQFLADRGKDKPEYLPSGDL